MKKISLFLVLLLIIPAVSAEKCGITNFVSCIPEKISEYFLMLLNAPLIPFLALVQKLLAEPVSIKLFHGLWGIMVYVISLFYGLLFLFSGLNFIVSGYDAEKRAKAKEWLQNTLLMIFFVQASYLIYSLINDVASLLAAGVINLIDVKFFLITVDNPVNLGLSIILALFYVLALTTTIIFLSLRYLLVAGGIVFFPIGLFLYFIPPLRDYGKLILNSLGILIFIPFFVSLELLIASKLMEIDLFSNFKILVMISGFTLVNLSMSFLLIFSLVKAAMSVLKSDVGMAVSAGIKYFK